MIARPVWLLLGLLGAPLAGAEAAEELLYDQPDWWSLTAKAGVVPGVASLHARAVDTQGSKALNRRVAVNPGLSTQVAIEGRWQSWRSQEYGLAWSAAVFHRRQTGGVGGVGATMRSLGVEGGYDVMWGPPVDYPVDVAIGPRLALGRAWQSEGNLDLMQAGQGVLFSYGVTAGVTAGLVGDLTGVVEIGYQGFVATTTRTVSPATTLVGDGHMTYSGQGMVLSIGVGWEM